MPVKKLTEKNFEEETKNGKWIIDFWAPWCAPCKKMKPVFKEASEEMEDINFGKVNIGEEQNLTNTYGIRSVPTFIKMEKGDVKGQEIGMMKKENIKEWMN